MGKTVLNQSDVESLYGLLAKRDINDMPDDEFLEVVQEVFAIYDDTEKENE
jgi:hypothetical protein